MTIEQDAKRISKEFVKIGFDVSKSIIDVLAIFLNDTRTGRGTGKYKEHFGTQYKSKEEMILHAKAEGIKDFSNITISDQNHEIKLLEKYCKLRGVDILIEKRPKNMEEIYQRFLSDGQSSLTAKEMDYFNAFTIKKGEDIILMESGAIIQFKSKDITLMEDIVKDVEHQSHSIKERKEKASEVINSLKGKTAEKTDPIKDTLKDLGTER